MRRFSRTTILLLALLTLAIAAAAAEGTISTTVLMRVSHMTQRAVVNVGEDLTLEVSVDGVTPAAYQWYFNDAPIEGAQQRVLNLEDAQVEDSGIYRMDALDEAGSLLVSVDVSARVIDDSVPQSGDASMPVGYAFAGIALCAALLAVVLRRLAMA